MQLFSWICLIRALGTGEACTLMQHVHTDRVSLSNTPLYAVSALERPHGQGSARDGRELVGKREDLAHDGGMRLVEQAATCGDALPAKLFAETGLRARSTFFFRSATPVALPLSTWPGDVILSATAARKAAQRAGLESAAQLLAVNSNRVLGDFNGRIIESRRSVESALERTLPELVSAAGTAPERAAEIRNHGEQAVKRAVAKLDAQASALEQFRSTAEEES